jgi:hypothetical protein
MAKRLRTLKGQVLYRICIIKEMYLY